MTAETTNDTERICYRCKKKKHTAPYKLSIFRTVYLCITCFVKYQIKNK